MKKTAKRRRIQIIIMKNLSKNPIAILAAFFAFVYIYSRFGPNLPISIISQQKGDPFIVTGTGKVTVTPDIAKVGLGIEESGASLKTVQNSVNTKLNTLTGDLKSLGINEKDIKTTNYNVYPEYNYETRPPKINGYRVNTNLVVTVRDFDKVNEVLERATGKGANVVGNISFEVNDDTEKKLMNEARKKAVDEAKEKASGLAQAAGITLGRIINVFESGGFETPPIALMEKQVVGLGGSPDSSVRPSIEPGTSEISVTVAVTWELR